MGEMNSNAGLFHSKTTPNLVIHPGGHHSCEQETLPYDAQLEAPATLPAHRLILTKE